MFYLQCIASERFLVSLQFGNLYNFPENYINFEDLFNKIAEISEILMNFINLLQKSSWFKKSFGRITYCIDNVK